MNIDVGQRFSRSSHRGVGFLAAGIFAAFLTADDATAQQYEHKMHGEQKAEIELHDTGITVPEGLYAGEVELTIRNEGKLDHGFALRGRMGEPGFDREELPALIGETELTELRFDRFRKELDRTLAPGESATMKFTLEPGVYIAYDPTEEEHERDEVGLFVVKERDEPVGR